MKKKLLCLNEYALEPLVAGESSTTCLLDTD